MPAIINASLSEFAQNYGHLAPPDDLHLRSFSCGDDSCRQMFGINLPTIVRTPPTPPPLAWHAARRRGLK